MFEKYYIINGAIGQTLIEVSGIAPFRFARMLARKPDKMWTRNASKDKKWAYRYEGLTKSIVPGNRISKSNATMILFETDHPGSSETFWVCDTDKFKFTFYGLTIGTITLPPWILGLHVFILTGWPWPAYGLWGVLYLVLGVYTIVFTAILFGIIGGLLDGLVLDK